MKTKITILMICGILFSFGLSAQTIYVNSSTGNDATGDGSAGNPYKTFHKGYTMTPSGGTLDLTGTFTWTDADETGDAATNGYTISKNITIQGQGADQTFIQAASTSGAADRRVFTNSSTIVIRNLTIRNGNLNADNRGGGIYTSYSYHLTIENCIIEDNYITTISTDNRYYGGGGIGVWSLSTGSVSINNCIIRNNSNLQATYGSGGGLFISMGDSNSGEISVSNSSFYGNSAPSGSAVKCRSPRLKLNNCTFANNTGSYAISIGQGSSTYNQYTYLTNITVAYNTGGGGLALSGSGIDYYVKNILAAENYDASSNPNDFNVTVTINDNGYNLVEYDMNGTLTNGINNNIVGNQDCLGLDNTLDLNSSSNISPTLALLSSSIAINAGGTGTNGSVTVPATDQRGTARVNETDIGAYEFTGTITTPDLTVSEISIAGFTYVLGAGPSASQIFTVSGVDLASDVIVTASTNYEVSDGGAYGSSVMLSPTGSTLLPTTVYVRLKSGLTAGARNGTLIVSTACDQETITLTGSVTASASGTYTWNGATNSDWNTASNWSSSTVPTNLFNVVVPTGVANYPEINNSLNNPASCYSLTINSDADLTILPNSGLSVSSNISNNGTVNINSSSAGEASLLVGGTVSGLGTFNVERYLSANQWHLVSSPITAGTAGVFQGIWLRPYLESTNTFGDYIVPTESPMPTGQGFGVWTNDNETRTYSGTINNGSVGPISLQLTGSAGINTGWNLIGNPYPSAIDWDAASGWTRTNVADAVYVWNGTQYAAYVGGIPVNGGSRYIAPTQGFFVQATSAGSSISMNNDVRLHNGVDFLKDDFEPIDVIRVTVSANDYSDEAVLAIRPSVGDIFDPSADAVKLAGVAEAPMIYTTKSDFSQLSINSQGSLSSILDKPVFVEIAQEGEHTLSWTHNLQESNSFVLFDNLLSTPIFVNEDYSYYASYSDMADRFTFVNLTELEQIILPEIYISVIDNTLFVFGCESDDNPQIEIYSIQGQKLASLEGLENNVGFLSQGIYMIVVQSENAKVVNKVFVK